MFFFHNFQTKYKYNILFMLIFLIGLTIVFIIIKYTGHSKPLWTPEDLNSHPFVNIKGISSDGKYTLIESVYPVKDEKNEDQQLIQCVLMNNKTLDKEIVLGALNSACKDSQFIGDGKKFTYLNWDNEGKRTLFIKDILSGKNIKIKELEEGVGSYLFSPDGNSFIYTQSEESETDNVRITWEEKQKIQKIYLQKIDKNMHLLEKPKLLTPAPLDMYSSDFSSHAWSSDSQKVIFTTDQSIWKSINEKTIYIFDAGKDKLKTIIESTDYFDDISFSPDGNHLIFSSIKGAKIEGAGIKIFKHNKQKLLHVLNLTNNQNKTIKISDRFEVVGWNKTGQEVIATQQKGTKTQLCSLNIHTQKLTLIPLPKKLTFIADVMLSHNQEYIGFSGQSLHRSNEIYVSTLSPFIPKKITSITEDTDLSVIRAETIKWKSFDGLEIEGILVYPQDYQEGQRVPLIVTLHGGPGGLAAEQFLGNEWLGFFSPAIFASLGYANLDVNYRGSSGYGAKFLQLSGKDLGEGAFQDIMTGVDYVIGRGIADPDQLFIQGHSLGGFLTAWAIGHTNRFKAAIVASGIVDWISDDATTDAPLTIESIVGCYYWNDYESWRKISPLSYVNSITTPTLILHGSKDTRVPVIQAQQLHQALQERGVPLRTVYYLEGNHGFGDAKVDVMNEMIAWFNKYRK